MQKINFQNLPNKTTPINASNLNQLQTNVETAINQNEPIGAVKMYAGANAPNGYFICDGSAISRREYADLFNVIGTTYGSGDGSTTFNIPNLKGRIVTGLDSSDSDFNTIGKTGGEKTSSQINCADTQYGLGQTNMGYSDRTIVRATALSTEHSEGSAQISLLQPFIVLNYIIKY